MRRLYLVILLLAAAVSAISAVLGFAAVAGAITLPPPARWAVAVNDTVLAVLFLAAWLDVVRRA